MQDKDKLAALAVEAYRIITDAREAAEAQLDELALSEAALDALFLELGVSYQET